MEPKTFCQSCSMPIDDTALRGTEKDGSLSSDYCTYCYQRGQFIQPNMSLEEMKIFVRKIMEERKIPGNIIDMAVGSLPMLKRWRGNVRSQAYEIF